VPAFERGAVPNANVNTANVISTSFFPMVDIPFVVWRIEPGYQCEVAKEKGGRANHPKRESGTMS
jgi:hypothetical protein